MGPWRTAPDLAPRNPRTKPHSFAVKRRQEDAVNAKVVSRLPEMCRSQCNPLMLIIDRQKGRPERPGPQWFLDLAYALQTRLEARTLLQIFSARIARIIIHEGIRFTNEALTPSLEVGRRTEHGPRSG